MFPEGSRDHANHTPLQGNEKERQMTDTSGRKCLGQFERYNRAGSWAKTFSALLIGTGDWYSRRCKLTWKLKGTKYNRMYFQLAPSTPPTDATGFGLLRTPSAQEPGISTERLITKDGEPAKIGQRAYDKHTGRLAQVGLIQQVQMTGLLPTPKTSEAPSASWEKRNPESKYKPGVTLTDLKIWGLLPTPRTSDCNSPGEHGNGGQDLRTTVASQTGETSHKLNPQFVLEMMGFPPDWTELPFQNGETKA